MKRSLNSKDFLNACDTMRNNAVTKTPIITYKNVKGYDQF